MIINRRENHKIMKNMRKLLLILGVTMFLTACEKEDAGYNKKVLWGIWERVLPAYESECVYYLIFSETELTRSVNCPEDISSETYTYTFDGKKIVTGSDTWEIIELSSTRMKLITSDSVREYKKP